MVKIRMAHHEDLPNLSTLFDAYRVFYKQKSDLEAAVHFLSERILNKESTIIVAEIEQKLVGFTQLFPVFSSVSIKKSLILNDLYVDPEYRSKGIATKLLNKAKEYAIKTGNKGLALETAIDNPAQKLYERLGWKKETDFLHYFWKAPD